VPALGTSLRRGISEKGQLVTRTEIIERWRSRLADWRLVGAQVNGEKLAEMVLSDLSQMSERHEDAELTLTEASAEGGMSTRQLARLIRSGALENVGRKNAPRVRRRDIPRKATARSGIAKSGNTSALSLQLARQAITSKARARGGTNGTKG
jgi:hypothetical protein